MSEKHTCEFCGTVGNNGARWLVRTADDKVARVHKPCGGQLIASAPAELKAALIPSPELKAEWTAKRTERQVQDFWVKQCPQLLGIKQDLEQKERTT